MVVIQPNDFFRTGVQKEGRPSSYIPPTKELWSSLCFFFSWTSPLLGLCCKSPPPLSHLRRWGGVGGVGRSHTPNQWEYQAWSSWVWTDQLTARDLNQTVTPWIQSVRGERRRRNTETSGYIISKWWLIIVYMQFISGVTHCRLMNRLKRQQTVFPTTCMQTKGLTSALDYLLTNVWLSLFLSLSLCVCVCVCVLCSCLVANVFQVSALLHVSWTRTDFSSPKLSHFLPLLCSAFLHIDSLAQQKTPHW